MKKFKSGDVVVIVKPWEHTESKKYGEYGVVETSTNIGIKLIGDTAYRNDQVVLSSVFNSPLYKALRENE